MVFLGAALCCHLMMRQSRLHSCTQHSPTLVPTHPPTHPPTSPLPRPPACLPWPACPPRPACLPACPQNLVTFGAGLVVAFINGWKMSLVVLACLPLLIFAAAIQAKYMMASGSKVRYCLPYFRVVLLGCTACCATAAAGHPSNVF